MLVGNAFVLTDDNGLVTTTSITDLPDDICRLILSFLPFRDGIKTRVLSRRWRCLEAFPAHMKFDQLNVFGTTREETMIAAAAPLELCIRFSTIVHKVLQEYKCPKMHSLELSYFLGLENCYNINGWVNFAFASKLETLHIDLTNCEASRPYSFPCGLLARAPHLEYLRLKFCVLASSPPSFGFEVPISYIEYVVEPHSLNSLKTIVFEKVNLRDKDALNAILSGCGSLKRLSLDRCYLPIHFHIRGPPAAASRSSGALLSIESLDILNCHGASKIEISHVRVAFLTFVDVLPHWRGDPNVVELAFTGDSALMETLHYSVLDFASHGLPQDLRRLQYLSLHLYSSKIQRTPAKLCTYYHLRELRTRIDLTTHFNMFSFAARVLDVCPYLEKFCLVIVSTERSFEREEITAWEHTSKKFYNHLKQVQIIGFCGDRCNGELELAKYLLHNAVGLETMIIVMCRAAEQVISFANGLEMKQIESILRYNISKAKLRVKLSVRDSSHFPSI